MALEPRGSSELDILAAIERGEVVSQLALTKRIGVSVGLINALLKRAVHKGYVKTKQVPYKRYAYYVTPQGFSEKSRLVAEYLDHSLRFFRTARTEYAELFASARKAGVKRIALVGGSELAEIAVLAAWAEDLTLVAIVDAKSNEPRRYGLNVVRSMAEVEEPDAVVVTDAIEPQQTFEYLRDLMPDQRILAPPFLRITRDRVELVAAQEGRG